MSLGKTKFPRKTCVVDRALRCRTGTSIVSGDQDNGCTGLCNTGCDSSDTSLGNKLYGNSCIFITVFQIVDQLSQILNRVNIMMRWWGDQADTRCGMTGLCNPRINLSTRKMTTLTRLCTLRHLNLDLLGTDKVTGGYTKTSGCHLLDCRTAIHFGSGSFQSLKTLTTLTAV